MPCRLKATEWMRGSMDAFSMIMGLPLIVPCRDALAILSS
jgi:hypothetical protein